MRPGSAWLCSSLCNHRFCAGFDTNGLVDLTVDGRTPTEHIDGNELSAICSDLLRDKLSTDHPVYFVTVGQFQETS